MVVGLPLTVAVPQATSTGTWAVLSSEKFLRTTNDVVLSVFVIVQPAADNVALQVPAGVPLPV
jgi:hypothetical protein